MASMPWFLAAQQFGYERVLRTLIFRGSAQRAHVQMKHVLRLSDQAWMLPLLRLARRLAGVGVSAGADSLYPPLILAAGLVKGDGFEAEDAALDAVRRGQNIIPGWRSIPCLVGPVEFGSFTRWPRLGNPGTVVWRDVPTRSTQNRIGLRNPGARAAAEFLARRRQHLPRQFGINLAVTPGVDDPAEQAGEIRTALAAFSDRSITPSWFTINLSCPNTEDDPRGNQTAEGAQVVCAAAREHRHAAGVLSPLWVKVGPNLGDDQYRALMRVFAATGIQAVVATNTQPEPAPGDPGVMAGLGGGRLHARAVEVAALLMAEKHAHGYPVDVVGCGGVLDGTTCCDFARLGVAAVQYWSALIYRGPLAAAVIRHEAQHERA